MSMTNRRFWLVAALIWGMAEATFFFVVPDLLLTASVLFFGLAFALRLAAAAAGAAALGGLLMWTWGANDVQGVHAFLLSVPLIGADLLARVKTEIAGAWPLNLTLGAVTGAPFKIYAAEAGAAGINPAGFAIVGFLARFIRFALAIGLTTAGAMAARTFGLGRWIGAGLALVWIAIYAVYVAARLNA